MLPPESQVTQPDAESFEDFNSALNEAGTGNSNSHPQHEQVGSETSGDEQINQEALAAYYNTSGV